MAGPDGAPGGPSAVSDSLLALALARPRDAITAARAVLAGRPSTVDSSVAHQAAGVALRQLGEISAAIRELRAALRLARASGHREREVDVLASLGATLGRAGRGREGLAFLDEGVRGSRGPLAGRVLLRRADVLLVLGRYADALRDLRGAVARLRKAGTPCGWPVPCSTAALSSSPSARRSGRTRTSRWPPRCTRTSARSTSTRSRSTTAAWPRLPGATFPLPWRTWTTHATASSPSVRRNRPTRSTAVPCCSPPASPRRPWPR